MFYGLGGGVVSDCMRLKKGFVREYLNCDKDILDKGPDWKLCMRAGIAKRKLRSHALGAGGCEKEQPAKTNECDAG